MDGAGTKRLAEHTAKNVGKKLYMRLDGEVIADPVIQESIVGGRVVVSMAKYPRLSSRWSVILATGPFPAKPTLATVD